MTESVEKLSQEKSYIFDHVENEGIIIIGRWEKIQELKNTIKTNSELIPGNIALALEQIENLEQAAQHFQERSSQKIFIKAIRIIRGIISDLPSNNDSHDLLTYISDLFRSMNMRARRKE